MRSPLLAAAPLAALVLSLLASPPALAEERRAAPHAPPAHHVENEQYFFGQAGVFDPGGDGDGAILGGGVGSRVNRLVAVELGLSAYSTEDRGEDLRVIPLLAGVRLILAHPVVEPYVGAAAGLCFTAVKDGGHDFSLAGQLSAGVDAWISPTVALNGELRYHFSDPDEDGRDLDVTAPSVVLGVRVGF